MTELQFKLMGENIEQKKQTINSQQKKKHEKGKIRIIDYNTCTNTSYFLKFHTEGSQIESPQPYLQLDQPH